MTHLGQSQVLPHLLLLILVPAESTKMFLNRLDKLWINQEFKFDVRADITGIWSRSTHGLSYVYKCLFCSDTDIEA